MVTMFIIFLFDFQPPTVPSLLAEPTVKCEMKMFITHEISTTVPELIHEKHCKWAFAGNWKVHILFVLCTFDMKNEKPHIKIASMHNRTIFAIFELNHQLSSFPGAITTATVEKSRDQIIFSFYTLCTIYVIVNADMHACMWNIENMFLMHFMCLWFGKSDIAHYFWDNDWQKQDAERRLGIGVCGRWVGGKFDFWFSDKDILHF